MKDRIRHLVVAAVLGIIAQSVWAQGSGWYVAGGLGASFPNDVDITQAGTTLTAELDTGILGTAAVGASGGGLRQLPSRR